MKIVLGAALFNKQQHPEERFWTYLGLALRSS